MFAVIVQDAAPAHTATIVATAYATVGLSVLAHGLLAARGGRSLRRLVWRLPARGPAGDGELRGARAARAGPIPHAPASQPPAA